MNRYLRLLLTLSLGLLCGVGLTVYGPWSAPHPADDAHAGHNAAPLQFQCPMHAQVVTDHPGACPICGMSLVPKSSAAPHHDAEHHGVLTIDPTHEQLIGLKVAPAEMGPVGNSWRTVGRVAAEEPRRRLITIKVEGYVEKLDADFVGKPVTRGRPLLSLYSPELLSAQKDFLVADKVGKAISGAAGANNGRELVAAARKRLLLWDISPAALDALEKSGEPTKSLPLISPITGVVTAKSVVEGAHVNAGDTLFEITDLSEVWVLADVYERELGRVRRDMQADLVLPAIPNTTFRGKVSFLDPMLDPKTRTARVRLTFPNPQGDLRPELYGDVIFNGDDRQGLRIPSDAVIHTGARTLVFIAQGQGRYAYREVKLGNTVGEHVEVLDGVKEGDEVVTQAAFLLDSEARLKGVGERP